MYINKRMQLNTYHRHLSFYNIAIASNKQPPFSGHKLFHKYDRLLRSQLKLPNDIHEDCKVSLKVMDT